MFSILLILTFVYSEDQCISSWKGDDYCDLVCMTKLDEFDKGDCLLYCTSSGCSKTGPDSICDSECDIVECGFDYEDCVECSPGCTEQMRTNSECDLVCNNIACNYDNQKCLCAAGCTPEKLSSLNCEVSCNNLACNYQNGKCLCATGCTSDKILSLNCEESCNNLACNYQNGKCLCAIGCTPEKLSSLSCEESCNNLACNYQNGKCLCSTGCTPEKLSSLNCEESCNNLACNYQNGKCLCAIGCTPDKLSSLNCDESCNNLACNYQNEKCLCSSGCTLEKLSSLVCYESCNNLACNYQNEKCLCSSGCTPEKLSSQVCDVSCNNQACNYQNGKCLCAPGCTSDLLINNFCDSVCNLQTCNYDNGKCLCAVGCSPDLLTNNICDSSCNVLACSYDNGDCLCNAGCYPNLLANTICDSVCNVNSCSYDNGKCLCSLECLPALLSNDVCDSACNVAACNYDNNKCLCNPGCTQDLLNNGICDIDCNVFACGFDNNDCFCEIEDGFYISGENCLSCHPSCLTCISGGPSDCLSCKPNFHLLNSSCICNISYFKQGENCLKCPESCLSCSSSLYYKCKECSTSLLEGICYKLCPLGYKKQGSNCILNNFQAINFRFDGSVSALQERNTGEMAEPCTKESEIIVYHRKGLFFNGLNTCFSFRPEDLDNPIIGPSFSMNIWVRSLNEFELFELFSSEEFFLRLSLSPQGLFSGVLNNEMFQAVMNGSFNAFEWNCVGFGLNYTEKSEFFYKINTKMINTMILTVNPYKDSENSKLILGSRNENKDFFKGFLFSFEIFNNFVKFEEFSIISGIGCEIFPKFFNECLDICGVNEFMTEDFKCAACPTRCKFGCIDDLTCQICKTANCTECDTLDLRICLKCENGFGLTNGTCAECRDSQFYNPMTSTCENCQSFCKICTEKICSECEENFVINSKGICECQQGFELNDTICQQAFFSAFLLIFSNNSVMVKFEKDLKEILTIESLKVEVNNDSIDFDLEKIDLKSYIINLKHLKSIKTDNRKIQVKFKDKIFSINNFLLVDKVLEGTLFDEEDENSTEDQKDINVASDYGINAFFIAGGLTVTSSLISFNPLQIFYFLNILEIYIYSVLFDLEFNSSFVKFIENLKNFTKIPNFLDKILKIQSDIPKKFHRLGIKNSFALINSIVSLIILAILMILQIFSVIFMRMSFRLKHYGEYLRSKIVFGFYLRFYFQFFLDLATFCLLSIVYTNFENIFNFFDKFFSIFFLSLLCFCFISMIIKLFRIFRYCSNQDSMKEMLNEFKSNSYSYSFYYLLFIFRRLILSISIVLFNDYFLQLTLNLVFSFIVLFYLISIQPFKTKQSFSFNFVSEMHIFVFYSLLLYFSAKQTSHYLKNSKTLIFLIISTFANIAILQIVTLVTSSYQFIKSKCTKANKIAPEVIFTTTVSKVQIWKNRKEKVLV